jgi:uncharacterized protein YqgV (UPF0045/DUF77 family)
MKKIFFGSVILFLIKLGLSGKTVSEFIIYVQNIIDKMTGNALYPTPMPTLADLQTELNSLTNLQEKAVKGGVEDTLKRDQQYDKVKSMVTKLGAYVEWKADNDAVNIASAGFETKKSPHPSADLTAPLGLVTKSTKSGAADLKFKKVIGRRIYVVQMCTNINTNIWTEAGKTTKTKFSVPNLISGKQYWFRVCASGIKGDSPFSDPSATFIS